MNKEHFTYASKDGKTKIHAIRWEPGTEVKAVLQISHGMTEYIDRYDEFAAYLTERGIVVVGNDHLGHGESVQSDKHYGFFAQENGNRVLLNDIHRLHMMTAKTYSDVPYFLLGHSMGSFLARQYLCIHGEELDGAIIMGTGYQPGPVTAFGMGLCRLVAKLKGWDYRSTLIDAMAFGGYNKGFGKLSGKEWLSRNTENVEKYMKDEWCMFRFTLNGYYNLFYSINKLSHKEYVESMPHDLPVFFVAGEEDPVGQFGKGVQKVFGQFQKLGMENISCKLYPKDRHEILNEIDRQDVYEDIYRFMTRCF